MAVALLAVASACGACASLGERKAQADSIIGSADAAIARGSATLLLTQRIELNLEAFVDDVQGMAPGAGGGSTIEVEGVEPSPGGDGAAEAASLFGGGIAQRIEVSQPGVVDLSKDRAAMLLLREGQEPVAVTVFDRTSLYVRRAEAAQEGAGASLSRPWVRVDLGALDADEIDNSGLTIIEASERIRKFQAAASPMFLLRLLRGTLSGSVEKLGTAEIEGVPTTHYEMNVDREKATKDQPEELAEAYHAVFKSLFVNSVVTPAEVWLDDEGLPRRFSITFKPRVRRRTFAELTLQVELRDFGGAVEVALPPKEETARVEGLGALANLSQRG